MNGIASKPVQLDRLTRARIAAHAGIDARTVDRALAGTTRPHPFTLRAIREAAHALGVALPEGVL